MNRLAGIIVAVVGLIVLLLGVLKILPGLTSTGAALIFLGVLVIGLSFVRKPDPEGTSRMSTAETLLGIFYAPTEIFQNLRRHPRWLVAILIMSALSSIYLNLFLYRLTPERVTNYAIDKTLEMSMIANNEEAKKQVESGRKDALEANKNPIMLAGQAVRGFVGQVSIFAFLAAIFFVFALAMGGKMNYWQGFSAGVYAWFPVAVIRFILNTTILFIKDPSDIHPITGQGSLIQDNLNFLIVPSEHPVLYTVLGLFSLLTFYWIWLNATGLKNNGENVSPTTAWTASLTLFFVMVALSAVMALVFPSFIS